MPKGKHRLRILTEIIFEVLFFFALLVIGYFGIIFVFVTLIDRIYPYLVSQHAMWALMYPRYQQYFILGFTLLYVVFSVIVLIWRVYHRYRTIQLGYILEDLHYISKGHYDHKISNKHLNSMKPIVDSVNRLVNSTVRAMEEERRIEQSKDELIGNMSHDIRTPLTSIIGYLGLLEGGRFETKEEAKHYASIAYAKALQMQKMVEDLFEYTKVSPVHTKLNIERTNVVRLLEQLLVEFEFEATTAHRKLELTHQQDEIWIEVDSEKLVRVLSNLVTNAFKYSGKRGTYVKISVVQQENQVQFTVENDGEQIPQEALEHLFQRFYRVDPSRTTKGSGLGLAIAESIVVLHQGKIWVESDKKSTRFIFVLPTQHHKNEEGLA